MRCFVAFVLLSCIIAIGYCFEQIRYAELRHAMDIVNVRAFLDQPGFSMDSVDTAVSIYNIRIPPGVRIALDPNEHDLGLIRMYLGGAYVTLGRDTFRTWARLASTLAHEIEVHANQSFVLAYVIGAADYVCTRLSGRKPRSFSFLAGDTRLEREAYTYEVLNAERFGLTEHDVQSIISVREHWYPIENAKVCGISSEE